MRVYLPPDANCLLSAFDDCVRSRNYVNVVVCGKHGCPMAGDGGRGRALHAKGSASGDGLATIGRRAGRGHGLLRRRPHAGDAGRRVHPSRASARV